jgi:hypothetical protein
VRTSRLTVILAAVAVGVVFLAGLFVHGPIGGILLLAVLAVLVALSSSTWATLPSRGRAARVIVIVAVAVLAVLKFAGKA